VPLLPEPDDPEVHPWCDLPPPYDTGDPAWWPDPPPDEPQAIAAGTPTTPSANTATVLIRTNCALTVISLQIDALDTCSVARTASADRTERSTPAPRAAA